MSDIDILVEVFESDVRVLQQEVQKFSTLYKGGKKYLRIGNVFGDSRVEADLWLVYPPRNFYALQAILTGPASLTIKMRQKLLQRGLPRPHGEIRVDSESSMFQLANLDFVPPEKRHTLAD